MYINSHYFDNNWMTILFVFFFGFCLENTTNEESIIIIFHIKSNFSLELIALVGSEIERLQITNCLNFPKKIVSKLNLSKTSVNKHHKRYIYHYVV